MAEVFDDDENLDDGWDDLPIDTLAELEDRAVELTQQGNVNRSPQAIPLQGSHTAPALPSASVPRAECRSTHGVLPERSSVLDQQKQPSFVHGHADRGTLVGVALNVNQRSATPQLTNGGSKSLTIEQGAQRHRWQSHGALRQSDVSMGGSIRRQQVSAPQQVPFRARQTDADSCSPHDLRAARAQAEVPNTPRQDVPASALMDAGQHPTAYSLSEAEIQELRRNQENLKRQLEEAKEEIKDRLGEVAIVRSNQAKHEKELERKLAQVQKQHEEELSKTNAELQQAIAEKKRLLDNNQFLQHNLQEVVVQDTAIAKGKDKDNAGAGAGAGTAGRDRPHGGAISTPRKSRAAGYGDGFDEDEIMVISPVKGRGRGKAGTPRAGAKRKKRSFQESPGQTLQLSQGSNIVVDDDVLQPNGRSNDGVLSQRINGKDNRLNFLQTILHHRTSRDAPWTFEQLATSFLPSKPQMSLASMLLERLSYVNANGVQEKFEVEICRVLLKQWSDCLEEKYYIPLRSLASLVTFCLALDTKSKAPQLSEDLVPLVQMTADVNAILRHQRAPASTLKIEINVGECLTLLHLTALGCMHDEQAICSFWIYMRVDFVLMLLKPQQPAEDVSAMLDLLGTSSLERSLGPIAVRGGNVQRNNEYHVVDQVSYLLVYVPSEADMTSRWSDERIAKLRIKVLKLLGIFCGTEHGGETLAKHDKVVWRLVKVINDQMDRLYDFQEGHSESAKQVSLATRLLHHLTTQFGQHFDLVQSVKAQRGGYHKFLVGLTRVAFSDGVVFEGDLDDEVMQLARRILDINVGPEEAQALIAAFI